MIEDFNKRLNFELDASHKNLAEAVFGLILLRGLSPHYSLKNKMIGNTSDGLGLALHCDKNTLVAASRVIDLIYGFENPTAEDDIITRAVKFGAVRRKELIRRQKNKNKPATQKRAAKQLNDFLKGNKDV
jgi:hypothetical protein